MENMRKRMKIRIVTNEKDCLKYSSRPTFINSITYGKNLVAINEKPQEIRLSKPIYVCLTVLEENKLEMYKFWYDFLKEVCKKIKLLYMDTDSFIFEVIEENFNDIRFKHKEHFDLSNFLKDSKYYDITNKKAPGKMKDEYPGKNIDEVIALKSKSYIIITTNNQERFKHKGHNCKCTGNEYRDALFSKNVLKHPLKKIISLRHKVFSKENIKKTLYNFCEKRYALPDGKKTYALGHKDTIKK